MIIFDEKDDDADWQDLGFGGRVIEPSALFSPSERDRLRRQLVSLWTFCGTPMEQIASRLSIGIIDLFDCYAAEISAAKLNWSIERLLQCEYSMLAGDSDATVLLVFATSFDRGGIPRLLAP